MGDYFAIAVVVAGTTAGSAVDLRTRRVPNALTFSLAAAGLVLAAMGFTRVGLPAACAGLLLGLVLMLPGYVLGATGGGDVKLLAATGTLLGPSGIVWAFVYTLIAGGAMALAVAACRHSVLLTLHRTVELVRTAGANAAEIEGAGARNRFAYAPAIAVGATLAAVLA
jgi:prepilin peptidase CpaA